MERYFIFCGDYYYPAGHEDYVGWADTIDIAEATIDETMKKKLCDWGYAMDMDGRKVLACRYCPSDERLIWS